MSKKGRVIGGHEPKGTTVFGENALAQAARLRREARADLETVSRWLNHRASTVCPEDPEEQARIRQVTLEPNDYLIPTLRRALAKLDEADPKPKMTDTNPAMRVA